MGRDRTRAAERKASQHRHEPPNEIERRASQIESFFTTGAHVQEFTPEEQPRTDVAQLQLILEGMPAYLTRAQKKLYTTFLLPQAALALADALTQTATALADRPVPETASGIIRAGAGTNLAAVAAQHRAADALRTGA